MTSSVCALESCKQTLFSSLKKITKMRFKDAHPMKVTLNKTLYRCYSPSAMTNAYRAVIEDHTPVKRAAVTYGVPQTTLRQRVLGRVNPETTSSGPTPELCQVEEAVFVEHLKSMAKLGYGYTTSEVVNMASNYATYLGKRDEENPFSTKWYRSFMKRWPELRVTKPRSLTNYRAKAASQETVSDYFSRLDHVLTKHDLKDKPHCVYNVDEKGIQTEHSPPYVVSSDNYTPAITSSRSATTTILGCGNAVGTMMPPFYIFKGKRFRDELLNGSITGSYGMVSDSGWSNAKCFHEFLEKHFIKYVQRGSIDQTVLLIFDGHKSHINVPVIEWAKENNIELFVLPAHTSHILQPLDVGCFRPLQRIYNSECHKFIRSNPYSNITRYNVAELSSKAYQHAMSAANLKSSFERTGIYPYNATAIGVEKLAPATVYRKPDSIALDATMPSQSGSISFFEQHVEVITKKQNVEHKSRETLSKITSGTCITEPDILSKIQHHQDGQKSSGKRKANASTVSTVCTKKRIAAKQKSCDLLEPVPGPSGLQVIPVSDNESDMDSDIADEEKCCVCHNFEPDEIKQCVSFIITKWAQCDFPNCKHWTHLIFCCKQRVVRRHDKFFCPCHSEE